DNPVTADLTQGVDSPDLGAEIPLFERKHDLIEGVASFQALDGLGGGATHLLIGILQKGLQCGYPLANRFVHALISNRLELGRQTHYLVSIRELRMRN